MPESVTLNNDLGVIEVRSHGKVTREEVARSVGEVERLRCETGIDRVLVNAHGQESLPGMVDLFELGAGKIPRTLKVAVLVSTDQAIMDDLRFAESVSLNRGREMRIFTSSAEALAWLKR